MFSRSTIRLSYISRGLSWKKIGLTCLALGLVLIIGIGFEVVLRSPFDTRRSMSSSRRSMPIFLVGSGNLTGGGLFTEHGNRTDSL
jgi:hypothetical protein